MNELIASALNLLLTFWCIEVIGVWVCMTETKRVWIVEKEPVKREKAAATTLNLKSRHITENLWELFQTHFSSDCFWNNLFWCYYRGIAHPQDKMYTQVENPPRNLCFSPLLSCLLSAEKKTVTLQLLAAIWFFGQYCVAQFGSHAVEEQHFKSLLLYSFSQLIQGFWIRGPAHTDSLHLLEWDSNSITNNEASTQYKHKSCFCKITTHISTHTDTQQNNHYLSPL